MDDSTQGDSHLYSGACFLHLCSLGVHFCAAGAAPSPHQVHLWLFMQKIIFDPSIARGSLVCSGSGMLGCGRHSQFGVREAVRWRPGEIKVLAAAS